MTKAKIYYFPWEKRQEFKEAILNAGGNVVRELELVNIYYILSNKLVLMHGYDGRVTLLLENEMFAESVRSDLENKLKLKLEVLMNVNLQK